MIPIITKNYINTSSDQWAKGKRFDKICKASHINDYPRQNTKSRPSPPKIDFGPDFIVEISDAARRKLDGIMTSPDVVDLVPTLLFNDTVVFQPYTA
ncbi:MAG: hypothetical protein V1753_00400 [Pseudomonadota bacterium]